MIKTKQYLKPLLALLAITLATTAHAGDLGQAARNMSNTLGFIANLATGVAYVIGFCYATSALLKFKKHHDSPSQMTIGTPITECFMAATLICLPLIANMQNDSSKKQPHNSPVAQTSIPGLTQLPAPNADFRNSDQEHFNEAMGLKALPKAPPPKSDPLLVDIRNQYRFD